MTDKTTETEVKNPTRERLEGGISEFIKSAKIYDETHTITHTPQYTDKVTEESLTDHVNFIRDAITASSIATSEIAYERAKENKDTSHWTGTLELPGISNQFVVHPSEGFHNPETEKDEIEYGHHDLFSSFHLGDEHTSVMNELYEIDKTRYADLFKTEE